MRDNWEDKMISEIGEVISGGTPSTQVEAFWNGNVNWITPTDLSKRNYPKIESSKKKITKLGLSNSSANLIPADSIVMSSRAPIGYFAIPSIEYATNQGCKSIILKNNEDANFHYYNFLFNVLTFKNRGEGTTFAEISKKTIEVLKFKIPPLPQQKKIAQILSTCDAVLEQTEATIAKYQALKQGMLHDLFTRGIDLATGQLRAKYEDAPELYKETELGFVPREWEVVTIGDVFDNLDGQRIPIKKEDREFMAGKIPYYGASGIIDYVNDFIFDEELILLGEDGENVVSRNSPLAFKVKGKTWINNHAHVLRPKNNYDIDFLVDFLESLDYSNIVSGSAQPKINQANLNKKLISLPKLDEQLFSKKRLLGLNKKINIEQQTLAKYTQLKAGLMQDLLSGVVGVEGLVKTSEA
tara:strand:- start:668 stop:1903 length:1236 start_codon:yes stop_codon:yes gene_type:complete